MIPKKRSRRIISCLNCRRKKRKCDRKSPCSQCVRVSLADTCSYDPHVRTVTEREHSETNGTEIEDVLLGNNTDKIPSLEVLEELAEKLKLIAKTHKSPDQFSLLRALDADKTGKYRVFHMKGFLGMLTLPHAEPSVLFMQIVMRDLLPSWHSIYLKDSILSEQDVYKFHSQREKIYGEAFIPPIKNEYNMEEMAQLRHAVTQFGRMWGIEYHPDPQWPLSSFKEQVVALIPPYTVVKLYLDCFFRKNCLGYPILEEVSFRTKVENFFTGEQATILSKSEIPVLVSLFLALRSTYVTLRFENELCPDFALQHPISLDVVHITEKLTRLLDIHHDSSIELLQALTASYCYRLLAPESDGYLEVGDPQTRLSEIFTVAKILRIGEDPRLILTWPRKTEAEKASSEWTKGLWCVLLLLDLEMCTVFGRSSLLRHSEINLHEVGDWAISETGYLKFVGSLLSLIRKLHLLVDRLFSIGSLIDCGELIERIADFEESISALNFKDIIGNPHDSSRSYRLRFLFTCTCFLVTVYYALYFHYEKKEEYVKSYEFLQKSVVVAHKDLGFVQDGFVNCWSYFFGDNAYLPLRPVLAATNKLQLIVLGRVNIRLSCSMAKLSPSLDFDAVLLSEILKSLEKLVVVTENESLSFSQSLSQGYYCSHWLAKLYRFGIHIKNDLIKKAVAEDFTDAIKFNYESEQYGQLRATYQSVREEYEIWHTYFEKLRPDSKINTETENVLEVIQITNMWKLVRATKDFFSETDSILWERESSTQLDKFTHQFAAEEKFFNGFITEGTFSNMDFNLDYF